MCYRLCHEYNGELFLFEGIAQSLRDYFFAVTYLSQGNLMQSLEDYDRKHLSFVCGMVEGRNIVCSVTDVALGTVLCGEVATYYKRLECGRGV